MVTSDQNSRRSKISEEFSHSVHADFENLVRYSKRAKCFPPIFNPLSTHSSQPHISTFISCSSIPLCISPYYSTILTLPPPFSIPCRRTYIHLFCSRSFNIHINFPRKIFWPILQTKLCHTHLFLQSSKPSASRNLHNHFWQFPSVVIWLSKHYILQYKVRATNHDGHFCSFPDSISIYALDNMLKD